MKRLRLKSLLVLCLVACSFMSVSFNVKKAYAMPFYDLRPQEMVLRSQFYTTYSTSSEERKHNIYLAAKSLNNVFVDVGAEFSFNKTVGKRTERRGYKKAKIIFNGQFIDGVGGGVCQVSTTLYNAVLVGGLEITEFHPHSLAVNYVAPSFDAMVNSGSADLRFINNTYNPIIIKTKADGDRLVIQIYGERLEEEIVRESVVVGEIEAPKERVLKDEKGEYPTLYKGEYKFLSYSKNGIKSEGYIIRKRKGKTVSKKKIRQDKYSALQGVVIEGTAERPTQENLEPIVESAI